MRQAPRFGARVARRAVVIALLATIVAACAGSAVSPPTSAAPDAVIVAEVATYQLVAGEPGRLLVALLTGDGRWLSFGSVGVRFNYLGDATATAAPEVTVPAATATFLSIPGTAEGDGGGPTLTFAADGRGVYAVDPITFPTAGYWQVVADGQLRDGTPFSADAAFAVLATGSVPTVGSPAPRTHNPVIGSPGIPLVAIDSRALGGQPIPDPELHSTSIADAIEAGHPAVVVFSTPVYCVSQFCGPVTDMIDDLAGRYGDRADFIHVEIYRDFAAGTVNQAALDWLKRGSDDLREPWTFFIGSDGRIGGSWDTVVTRGELEPILQALPPE